MNIAKNSGSIKVFKDQNLLGLLNTSQQTSIVINIKVKISKKTAFFRVQFLISKTNSATIFQKSIINMEIQKAHKLTLFSSAIVLVFLKPIFTL